MKNNGESTTDIFIKLDSEVGGWDGQIVIRWIVLIEMLFISPPGACFSSFGEEVLT